MPLQNEGIFSGYLRKKRQTISSKYCKGLILDFGSGDGSFSEYFEYDKYIGYEPDHDSISDAKKTYRNKKFISSIEESQDLKIDTVAMIAVIEHLDDPEGTVELLKNKFFSNKKGFFVITTPNKYFDKLHHFGANLGLFSQHAADEHNIMFNKKDLFIFAKKTNLEVIKFKRFLFGVNQLIVLKIK